MTGDLSSTHGPFPLGAHPVEGGVRFAVSSTVADAVQVCLVDEHGGESRVELTEQTFGVWHGTVPGIGPGQRYGYRVHGPYDPERGLRCNPAKLLVDPYARRITGALTDLAAALDYDPATGGMSDVDSLGHVPLSVVTAPSNVDTGVRPEVPFAESVVYELHVRGFTRTHPDVPEHERGTYLGLAHPAVVEYLRALGVTAVELLPVHAIGTEPALLRTGRVNYWGYSTLGFFAPHAGYASVAGNEVDEFATMTAALHAAGIEVLLDVVYNHTCEGGVEGPSLSWRGLDDTAYYLREPDGDYRDLTGCRNSLDAGSPTVVRMVTDSLRHWMGLGVDGFRFDLASVLGRPGGGAFDADSALLTAITTDPLLCRAKLIAEPWDATAEGYQVGGFATQWAEWNGRYRDSVRDFWRGATGVRDLGYRLSGSSDLYNGNGRRPWASVNFVTAHDGFTLRDLVSYDHKHNEANGEHNRDGTDDNRSWNCGVEGETDDAGVNALRGRQARNLLATLLLATGTPMLTAGDERWRTQGGNNNAYCLDDETAWLDWAQSERATDMVAFTRRLTGLRAASPALRQGKFFDGRPTSSGEPDLVWFAPDGEPMTDADWFDESRQTLGMWLEGGKVGDDSWLLLLHAGADDLDLTLPDATFGKSFVPVLDTAAAHGEPADEGGVEPGAIVRRPGRSLLLLRALRE